MTHVVTRGWVFCAFMIAGVARGGPPHSIESRGGADVLSGAERLRVAYIGDNDSFEFLRAPDGHGFDRWITASTQLYTRFGAQSVQSLLPVGSRAFFTASLLQNIQTPRSAYIADREQLHGDRPYSGWLAAAFGSEIVLPRGPLAVAGAAAFTHAGVDLYAGLIGPWSLAGQTQRLLHRLPDVVRGIPVPPAPGWGSIETAPGLSLDAAAYAETSLLGMSLTAPAFLRWSGASAGLYWLAGVRGDAGSMLIDGAVNTRVAAGWLGDPCAPEHAAFPLVAYLFAAAEARAVAFNRAIDGALVDGQPAARSSPFTEELSLGATVRAWNIEASFATVYRSNEAATLPAAMQTGQTLWRFSAAMLL